jgi:hypothetical protein
MNRSLAHDLQQFGHLARTRDLQRLGHSPGSVRSAVERGDVLRVRNGWVATRQATRSAVVAVRHGGKLTGASALASYGVWSGTDRRLHIAMPPKSHVALGTTTRTPLAAFEADRFLLSGVERHWAAERWPTRGVQPAWRASVGDALLVFAMSESVEHVLAAIESAVHEKALARSRLAKVLAALPRRLSRVERELDLAAESGLETISRLRLSPTVKTVESQVTIPGVGRVDLLIDGWLVIELIGDEFHTPEGDRKRQVDIVRAGYRGLFFGYDQVMFEWAACEAAVAELLREGRSAGVGR